MNDADTYSPFNPLEFDPAAGGAPASPTIGTNQLIKEVLATHDGIRALRISLFEAAQRLGKEYSDRRTKASESFSNLNLSARMRGRSVQIQWVLYHFKNGRRNGVTNVPKPRSVRDYDLATVKRKSPEWLHEIAIETELKARPLRECFARLIDLERDLEVIANRVCPGLLDGEALLSGCGNHHDEDYP